MTSTQNPTAIAMIEDMIDTNDASITLNERTMITELENLKRLTAQVLDQLEQGQHIESNWLRGAAHKVEDAIAKRRSLHETKANLIYVLKAAGKE